MFFNVQGDCNQMALMTIKGAKRNDWRNSHISVSCSYHVSKVGHAKTVGLDACVGQNVVHQHHSAVVEPDLPAVSLL